MILVIINYGNCINNEGSNNNKKKNVKKLLILQLEKMSFETF